MATDDIAQGIAKVEGWSISGSLAQRNNNPGNLRYVGQAGAVPGDGGFAYFSSPEDGWAALNRQIELDASRGLDLSSFMQKYAPSQDGNDPTSYAAMLANGLGVSPFAKLSDIISGVAYDDSEDTKGSLEIGASSLWLLAGAALVGLFLFASD